jgi:hypothetical protein
MCISTPDKNISHPGKTGYTNNFFDVHGADFRRRLARETGNWRLPAGNYVAYYIVSGRGELARHFYLEKSFFRDEDSGYV